MQYRVLIVFLMLFFFIGSNHASVLPPGFAEELIVGDLDPTRMAIAPDGRLFLAEKNGTIRIYKDGKLNEQPYLQIKVDNFNERGLVGLVLDPDFDRNGYVYVYYTVDNEDKNRVSRFQSAGDYALPGSEEILIESTRLGGSIHNGGEMIFGPDGKLFIAFGDGSYGHLPQDSMSLFGKFLRINADGSIPDDNPFYDNYEGIFKSIYAIGFRNPFTFDIDQNTGMILANDVGNMEWEEINEIKAGYNYGWPLIEGAYVQGEKPDNYLDPVYQYPHENGFCAVIGSAFYNPETSVFPDYFQGKYLFSDYCKGSIRIMDPADFSIVETFADSIDRPISIKVAPNGDIYYIARSGIGDGSPDDNTASENGQVFRIFYAGIGEPFISKSPNDLLLSIGEEACFEVAAGGSNDLNYQWFRNGNLIENETSEFLKIQSVQLIDDGDQFYCQVSNTNGQVNSNLATLNVVSNQRPKVQIIKPVLNASYTAGDVLFFEGLIEDPEDGMLNASDYEWTIQFMHEQHSHPFLSEINGTTGSIELPQVGETSDNVWYRIFLKGTDSEGFSSSEYVDIFPNKSQFEIQSIPEGVVISVDGQSLETPIDKTAVQGMQRIITAPQAHFSDEGIFLFKEWSNGQEDRILYFEVGNEQQEFLAIYEKVEEEEGEGLLGCYYNTDGTLNEDTPIIKTRIDTVVNFMWGESSPFPDEIKSDFFIVKWKGKIRPLFTSNYKFYTRNDDGARLRVNGELIIDDWTNHGVIESSARIELEALTEYEIELDYFDSYSNSTIQLSWSSNLIEKQIIPKSVLKLPDSAETGNQNLSCSIVYNELGRPLLSVKSNQSQEINFQVFNRIGQLLFSREDIELLIGTNLLDIEIPDNPNDLFLIMVTDEENEIYPLKFKY